MPKSKHRHRHQPIPNKQNFIPPMPPAAPKMQIDLGYDPTGPSESVDIVSTKEGWSEFTLQDGTVIRTKGVLLDAKKMTGQFTQAGDPIYAMQIIMAQQVRIPDHLKKKG